MALNKTDLLLQYAILLAGQEDESFDRQLGPIHLIKYVYLADLAHAGHHRGETYTDVKWQFHKYGPWSQSVNERIEPALRAIGADKQIFLSDFGDKDEWVRWQITHNDLLEQIEAELPLVIAARLQTDVHKYGNDTRMLLNYVYRTSPMLSAAPNEFLDFTPLNEIKNEQADQLKPVELTARKKKQLKEKIRAIQEKHAKGQYAGRKTKRVNPVKSPRYDDVYHDGLKWLDSLAGPAIDEGEKEAVFDDSVWKSETRRGDDVS